MLDCVHDSFLVHLVETLGLATDKLPVPSRWSHAGNNLAMLSLRLDALTIEEINEILERLESAGNSSRIDLQADADVRRFGEVAVELGFLTTDMWERLLAVQAMNLKLQLAQKLVVRGDLQISELLDELSSFLRQSA